MKKIVIIVLLTILSCKGKNTTEKINDITKDITKIAKKATVEIKYVSAKSGLIYRDAPKGKRLGKIPFDTKVVITEHTSNYEEIKSGGELIKGEWVGFIFKNKTVYAFDGFLIGDTDQAMSLSFKEAQEMLQGGVWVSYDYLNILKKTGIYSEARFYRESPHNLVFHDENKLTIWSEFETDELEMTLNEDFSVNDVNRMKIISLNVDSLTLKINRRKHSYFKIAKNARKETSVFELVTTGTEITNKIWFKGEYNWTVGNKTKKMTFSENSNIRFLAWYEPGNNHTFIDLFDFNGELYKITKFINNTYYLDGIQAFEEGTAPKAIPTGEKVTLSRIINETL